MSPSLISDGSIEAVDPPTNKPTRSPSPSLISDGSIEALQFTRGPRMGGASPSLISDGSIEAPDSQNLRERDQQVSVANQRRLD